MKTKISLVILLAILFFGVAVDAQEVFVEPLKKAHIKMEQVDWKTYSFSVRANVSDEELSFAWTVDGSETFYSPAFKYVFPSGAHTVSVSIKDRFGNTQNDAVKINAFFWRVANPWLWCFVYLIIVAFILYYWAFKVFYLAYRTKVHHEAKIFLDAMFDKKGLLSKIIEMNVKKVMLRAPFDKAQGDIPQHDKVKTKKSKL